MRLLYTVNQYYKATNGQLLPSLILGIAIPILYTNILLLLKNRFCLQTIYSDPENMFRVAALRGGVSSVIRTSLTNRSVLKPSLPSSLSAFRSINDAATPPLDTTLEASANIMQHSGFSQIVEPTFASLGLAHGYPSGMMQAILEVIHVHGGLPWWSTIAASTKK